MLILYRAPRTGGTILTAGEMCWQKNLSQRHLSTTDLIRSSLRSKLGVRDEFTQTNCLSHGRHFVTLFHVSFDITNSLGPFFNPIKPTATDISHGAILLHYISHGAILLHYISHGAILLHYILHGAILLHYISHDAILLHYISHDAILLHYI